jgi:hypothetical protein
MSTDTDVTGPRLSSYMNLEQAMGEVRAYLDKKKFSVASLPGSAASPAGQLSLQAAFVARLADIANRLGQVEPNSKLGPPGVFLKRVVRKLIGWYSRPAQEFDRTTVETFQQIRHDMLQLQQQILVLSSRVEEGLRPAIGSVSGADPSELLRSMLTLFKGLIVTGAVRQAVQSENPELLNKIEGLLETVEVELKNASQVPGAKVRT